MTHATLEQVMSSFAGGRGVLWLRNPDIHVEVVVHDARESFGTLQLLVSGTLSASDAWVDAGRVSPAS